MVPNCEGSSSSVRFRLYTYWPNRRRMANTTRAGDDLRQAWREFGIIHIVHDHSNRMNDSLQ